MAQVQEIWNKLNPRERLTGIGALVVVLAWIVGLTARGSRHRLARPCLGAVAVLVVLYLKYANPDIKWPIHVSLIILAVAAIVAARARCSRSLTGSPISAILGITGLLSLGLYVVGDALMVWGAWQEYQVEKPALPNILASSASTASRLAPPPRLEAPPAAPAAPAETPRARASAVLEQLERRHDLGTSSRHHTGRAELTARPRHVCRADRRATMLRRT